MPKWIFQKISGDQQGVTPESTLFEKNAKMDISKNQWRSTGGKPG